MYLVEKKKNEEFTKRDQRRETENRWKREIKNTEQRIRERERERERERKKERERKRDREREREREG